MTKVNYNERSWAIDLISEINLWLVGKRLLIKRAGGENTLKAKNKVLFPDVLLFGDDSQGKILQGWELKMPDTPIDDIEFINNAKTKALNLSLNSFLLWNVSSAALYILEGNVPKLIKVWNNLFYIRDRSVVASVKDKIKIMLYEILNEINGFLQNGQIKPSGITDLLGSEGLAELIQNNLGSYTTALMNTSQNNNSFNNEIVLWWRYAKNDFPEESNKFIVLARNNLLFITNKFLFAHILKSYRKDAAIIDNLDENSTVEDVIKIFENISKKCDFWNIFQQHMGEEVVPKLVLEDLLSFNLLLKEFNFLNIDKSLLHDLIGHTVYKNKRKLAGQFTTPPELAKLLVLLTVKDRSLNTIDPCCGSGTILKEVYDLKRSNLSVNQTLNTLWGSDKFSLPLQMAMFNFVNPEVLGYLIQMFKEDAINLFTNKVINFNEPFGGKKVNRKLPKFGYIISNLPFVQYEDIEDLNPNIKKVNNFINKKLGNNFLLDGRSDLYAYLPFYFWKNLEDNGYLGIIVSNSWLGTKWGQKFYYLLKQFYKITVVVTSGKGRWFNNAKVVTNILVLQKKSKIIIVPTEKTKFAVLRKAITDYSIEELSEINALITKKENVREADLSLITYCNSDIEETIKNGLNLNSLFANNLWLKKFSDKLIKVSDIFSVARGERRGWDNLFYPEGKHNIENLYLKPVLKTPRSISSLIAKPDALAFCCDKTIEELKQLEHFGALSWIEKFEKTTNETGILLPLALARAHTNWYTMSPNTMGELVMNINFGDRLFVAKFEESTFVNQRLIRFTKKNGELNLDLCHALMNSVLGLFYLEAMGTGRGEGALDLSKDKIEAGSRIINPDLIDLSTQKLILQAFEKIKSRPIYPIYKELQQEDRKLFDVLILKTLSLENLYPSIKNSLLEIYSIRSSM